MAKDNNNGWKEHPRTDSNPRGAGRPRDPMHKHPAWERLRENILGVGTIKFWGEMDKLEGKDYIITYLEVLKFFKPRLASQLAMDIATIPTIELVRGMKQIAQNGRKKENSNGDDKDIRPEPDILS